jgi:hypothetical protein
METFYIHNAIRKLYPNVITIRDNESFDENNNLVNIDMNAVTIEAERLSNIKPVSFEDMIKAQQALIQELSAKVSALENKS